MSSLSRRGLGLALLVFGGTAVAQQEERLLEVWLLGPESESIEPEALLRLSSEGSQLEGTKTEYGAFVFRVSGESVLVEVTCRSLKALSYELKLVPASMIRVVLRVDPTSGRLLEATQTPLDHDAQSILAPPQQLGPPGSRPGRVQPSIGSGSSGAPLNDSCFDSIEVFDGITEYSRFGATTDGPPHPGACQYDGQTPNDVWFHYRASCEGTLAIHTCRLSGGFNTDLVVYPGDADGDGDMDMADCSSILSGSVLPLACNDDSGGCGSGSAVELSTLVGELYLIRLGGPGAVFIEGVGITCAPPPPNDECDSAIEIPCNSSIELDNTGATTNPADPLFPCLLFNPPVHGAGSTWFRFTAEGTNVHISTGNPDQLGFGIVSLYAGECGALTELACNDSTGPFGGICFVDLVPGNSYYIQLAALDAGLRGLIVLNVQCPGLCIPPLGDSCSDAPLLGCNGSVAFQNFGAHAESTDPPFSCRVEGPAQGVGSVWRRFVATAPSAKLSLNSSTIGLDTLLAVYSGTCGNFTELACSDDDGFFHLSELAVDGLTVGETYYVQVASLDRFEVGAMILSLQCPNPAPPNDECDDAIELGLPAVVEVDSRRAISDPVYCGTLLANQRNVWYRVTGTGNLLTASVCHERTTLREMQINVFCGDCGELTCVAGARGGFCPFGTPNFAKPSLSFCTQAGASYLLSVGTTRDESGGGDRIHLEVFDTGQPCTPEVACLPTGACCLLDGGCADATEAVCAALGGTYRGDDSSCTLELVADGGFESGPLAGPWSESSTNFDTLVCQVPRCGFGGGSGPRSGSFWAWFGGTFAFEEGALEQTVVIPAGAATLDFYLELPVSSGNGVDFLRVTLDGLTVFEVLEGDPALAGTGYKLVSLPLGIFADGQSHALRFESLITGEGAAGSPALSNFFVDDVSIRVPGEGCSFVLDFEREDDFASPLANGQSISTPPEFGRLVSISSSGPNAGAAIFDTTPGGPNDPSQDRDLLVGRGHVLILQNDQVPAQTLPGFFDRPNDDQDGGEIVFAFPAPREPESLVLIDIDQGSSQASLVLLTDVAGRRRTYTIPARWTEDLLLDGPPGWRVLDLTTLASQPGFLSSATALQDAGFDPTRVLRVQVHLGSSGAIDELVFR